MMKMFLIALRYNLVPEFQDRIFYLMLLIKLGKYKYCMHSYSPNVLLLLIVLWKIKTRFRRTKQISCRLNRNGTHFCIYSYNGMRLYLIGQHKTRSTTLGRTLPQKYPGRRNAVMNACDWLICKLRPTTNDILENWTPSGDGKPLDTNSLFKAFCYILPILEKEFKIPAENINNYFINLYNISGWLIY